MTAPTPTLSPGSARAEWARLDRWIGVIRKSRLFWAVLALKLLAGALFAGANTTNLFIPFLDEFVRHPLTNPYDTFWAAHRPDAFPYGSAMLSAMALPRLALALFGLDALPQPVLLLVTRLPVLAADLAVLLVLGRWLRQRIGRVLWLYWANPVLFYINYLHGQLDAVPMGFALISAYYLFSNRPGRSAALLGMAIAAKAHLLLMLPFALVYLWQERQRLLPVARYAALAIGTVAALNLPYLASDGFVHMVFRNAQQGKVLALALSAPGADLAFYLVPAAIVMLLALSLLMRIGNRDVFVFFVGGAYGALLLLIPPAPGWYYWVLPWFAYFYARIARRYLWVFALLHAAYFAYFAVIPASDYLTLWHPGSASGLNISTIAAAHGLPPRLLASLAFTLLQTVLLINCVIVFQRGVQMPQRRKLRARPFMLGIAGDSGAGKSTVSAALLGLFGPAKLEVICGDDAHKWQRGDDRWQELTHLDPRANELHAELDTLRALHANRPVRRRLYDHDTGTFTQAVPIAPRPVIVLEGLHAFYLKSARELYDLRLFIKPDPALQLHRKLIRDIARRGHTRAAVLASVAARRADSERYVAAQEPHADLVVSVLLAEPLADAALGDPATPLCERLSIALSNDFPLDPLLADLAELLPTSVHHHYDGNDRQIIAFDEPLTLSEIATLGERHVGALEQLGLYDPGWADGWLGLIQLITAYCMFHGWESEYGD